VITKRLRRKTKTERAMKWDDVMREVWEAQKRIKPADLQANPVLEERARRRR
jgi:hypothetical protein